MHSGQVVGFRPVGVQVVQFPRGVARPDELPAAMMNGLSASKLEEQRFVSSQRFASERRRQADAFQRRNGCSKNSQKDQPILNMETMVDVLSVLSSVYTRCSP